MNQAVSIGSVLSTTIGALFVAAAVAKATARQRVERFVIELGVTHGRASTVVVGVIAAELVVGGVMLTGAVPLIASVAAVAVLVLFVVVQARAFRSTAHPCGCFGAITVERSHHVGLVRATALLAASVLVIITTATGDEPMASRLPTAAESLAGVMLAVTVLLTSTLLDQTLWFNNARLRGASSR
jgi:hypothetical protein